MSMVKVNEKNDLLIVKIRKMIFLVLLQKSGIRPTVCSLIKFNDDIIRKYSQKVQNYLQYICQNCLVISEKVAKVTQ